MTAHKTPFNSPLETGVRALTILVAFFPKTLDLQHIVDFDYLVVHSGDAGGPESLHVALPFRTGELLVRRKIIETGLLLMISRGLIKRLPSLQGIQYIASDEAVPFLNELSSVYINKMRERAIWVADNYGDVNDEKLGATINLFFKNWTTQFQHTESFSGETL